MRQVVDQLNLRKTFETDEVRDKLRMAGFRGEAPAMRSSSSASSCRSCCSSARLIYFFLLRDHEMPPIARLGASMGIGYIGFYLPSLFLSNLIPRRQSRSRTPFPTPSTCC